MSLCLPSPRKVAALIGTLTLVGAVVVASPALASSHHHHHHSRSHASSSDDNSSDDSGSTASGDSTTPDSTAPDSTVPAAGGTVATGSAQTISVETTAYSYGDNQGSNNATICCGVLHKTAAGDGSFQNPITLAVPGSGGNGMQTPKGTRVYFTKYRFYGIVEDSGATPKKLRRFDIWSDGRGNSSAESCMDDLSGTSSAILNPPAGKPVAYVGPRSDSKGCHAS
jgi:hypothetical protein